jgi:hypothetical protein
LCNIAAAATSAPTCLAGPGGLVALGGVPLFERLAEPSGALTMPLAIRAAGEAGDQGAAGHVGHAAGSSHAPGAASPESFAGVLVRKPKRFAKAVGAPRGPRGRAAFGASVAGGRSKCVGHKPRGLAARRLVATMPLPSPALTRGHRVVVRTGRSPGGSASGKLAWGVGLAASSSGDGGR